MLLTLSSDGSSVFTVHRDPSRRPPPVVQVSRRHGRAGADTLLVTCSTRPLQPSGPVAHRRGLRWCSTTPRLRHRLGTPLTSWPGTWKTLSGTLRSSGLPLFGAAVLAGLHSSVAPRACSRSSPPRYEQVSGKTAAAACAPWLRNQRHRTREGDLRRYLMVNRPRQRPGPAGRRCWSGRSRAFPRWRATAGAPRSGYVGEPH